MRDLPQPPTLLPGGKPPGKLVVVESVYHQRRDAQPAAAESRFSRWLATDAPAYVDEFTAEAEWQPVQMGRVKAAGMVVAENLEGTDLVRVPTPEQRAEVASRVLAVAFLLPGEAPSALLARLAIPPGESARFQPAAGVTVYLRAAAGQVRARVTTIPA
jgi:hypothetical protein